MDSQLPLSRSSDAPLVPAVQAKELQQGELLVPRATFEVMLSGNFDFIRVPEGCLWMVKPRITDVFSRLLTRRGLADPQTWYDMLAACGSLAHLYVMDRYGERYKVIDVTLDPGGETGVLIVNHLGRRSRSGYMSIDIHDAYGKMLPFVSYKEPYYKNPTCQCIYRRNADTTLRESFRRWQSERSRESWVNYLKEANRAGAYPFTEEGLKRATGARVVQFTALDDGFKARIEYVLRPHIEYVDYNDETPQTLNRGPYDGSIKVVWDEAVGDNGPNLYLTIDDLEIEMGQEGYDYHSTVRTFYGGDYHYHGAEVFNDADLEAAANSDDWEQL